MKESKTKANFKIIFAVFPAMFLLIVGIVLASGCGIGKAKHTHDYMAKLTEPTCTEQGYTTYTCACGESYVADTVEKRGHLSGEWAIVTNATETANGLIIQKCASCGEKIKEEILITSLDLNFDTYGDGTCFVNGIGSCTDTIIVIPSTYNGMRVTSISHFAFKDCSDLTNIIIPDSVTNIGSNVFDNCDNLTSITVDSNNPIYASFNGVLFNKELTNLLRYPTGKAGDYTIPSTVTSIGDEAFDDCAGVTSIIIHDRLTSIGDIAFSRCNSLTNITVDSNNPIYASVDGVLFNKDITKLVYCPVGKTGAYTIPNTVTSIGERAFQGCENLTGITIPDSVMVIGNFAFQNCKGLTIVTIPISMTSIQRCAFQFCYNLATITFNGTISEWHAVSKGHGWGDQISTNYVTCSDGSLYIR